jgi:hypothetical protein
VSVGLQHDEDDLLLPRQFQLHRHLRPHHEHLPDLLRSLLLPQQSSHVVLLVM